MAISRKRPWKHCGIIRFANTIFEGDQKSLAVEGELQRGPKLTGWMDFPFFDRTGIGFVQRDNAMRNMHLTSQLAPRLLFQEREEPEQLFRLMLACWGRVQRLNERSEGLQRWKKEERERA